MSEEKKSEWVNRGVAHLSRSGKSITINLNNEQYSMSVKGVQGLIDGSYATTNVSQPVKK